MTLLIENITLLKKLEALLIYFRNVVYFLLGSILTFIVLWCLGFLFFLGYLSFLKAPVSPYDKTDALVVLTGGKDRITTGLSLLSEEAASHLFISGVKKNVTGPDIVLEALKKSPSSSTFPKDLSKMQLGHGAKNTHENAEEVALWIKHQNILNASKKIPPLTSIRLVTSVYHMPRSLLEFQRALTGITLIPHPVFSTSFQTTQWWKTKSALMLSFSEYVKYNLALVRIISETISPFLRKINLMEDPKKTDTLKSSPENKNISMIIGSLQNKFSRLIF